MAVLIGVVCMAYFFIQHLFVYCAVCSFACTLCDCDSVTPGSQLFKLILKNLGEISCFDGFIDSKIAYEILLLHFTHFTM